MNHRYHIFIDATSLLRLLYPQQVSDGRKSIFFIRSHTHTKSSTLVPSNMHSVLKSVPLVLHLPFLLSFTSHPRKLLMKEVKKHFLIVILLVESIERMRSSVKNLESCWWDLIASYPRSRSSICRFDVACT